MGTLSRESKHVIFISIGQLLRGEFVPPGENSFPLVVDLQQREAIIKSRKLFPFVKILEILLKCTHSA